MFNSFAFLIAAWYFSIFSLAYIAAVTFDYFEIIVAQLFIVAIILIPVLIILRLSLKHRVLNVTVFSLPRGINFFNKIGYLLVPIFVVYNVQFYTGMDPFDVVNNLGSGVSNYLIYQDYFLESGLSDFSASKISPILIGVYIKFGLFAAIYNLILGGALAAKRGLISSLVVIFSYIYYSVARGTNFELFEIIMMSLFLGSMKYNLLFITIRRIKVLFLVIFLLIFVLSYFLYAVNVRAVISCYTAELCLNESSLLYFINEDVAYLTFALSGYFVFGSKFIGNFLIHLVDNNLWFDFSMPYIFRDNSITQIVCRNIDCGVNWQPDLMVLLNSTGLILFLPVLFFFLYFLCEVYRDISFKSSLYHLILGYLIFLYIVSLPIGQFISTSSANLILLFMSGGIYLFKRIVLK